MPRGWSQPWLLNDFLLSSDVSQHRSHSPKWEIYIAVQVSPGISQALLSPPNWSPVFLEFGIKKPTDLVVQGGFCLFRADFRWGSFLLHRHLQALCELDSVALVLSQKFPRRSTGAQLLVLLTGLIPVLCPLVPQQICAWEIQCLQLKTALSLWVTVNVLGKEGSVCVENG